MSILTSLESQITGAVEKLSESVVSIDSVRVTRDFAYGVVPIEGKGSGLIIDSKGYVITNNHVIDGAAKVQIHLKDGRSFVGEVVGTHSAMIPYAQGVGFAIPVNTIKWVMQQIREKGRVVRPWLGIYGTTLNEALARRYDLPADSGVLVVEVDARGPAYRSGLRVGDVIIGIGSQTINQMKDVLSALSKHAISEEVDLRFIRTGTKRVTRLLLQETPLQTVQRR